MRTMQKTIVRKRDKEREEEEEEEEEENFSQRRHAVHEIAVFICVGEILLGLALLVGALPKLTSILTTGMMLFFTELNSFIPFQLNH